jgi:PAS domain S-box-containing protein
MSAQIVADADGRVVSWDAEAVRLLGFTEAEMAGRLLGETIVPPRFRDKHRQGMADFRATGTGPAIGKLLQVTALRKDGAEIPIDLRVTQLSANPPSFLGRIDPRTILLPGDPSELHEGWTGTEHSVYAADTEAQRGRLAAELASEVTEVASVVEIDRQRREAAAAREVASAAESVAADVRTVAAGVERQRQRREEVVAGDVAEAASTAEERRIKLAADLAVIEYRRTRAAADVAAEVAHLTSVVGGLTSTAEGVKSELVKVKEHLIEVLAATEALHAGYGVDESSMRDRAGLPAMLTWFGHMREEARSTGKTWMTLLTEVLEQRILHSHVMSKSARVVVPILTGIFLAILGIILTHLFGGGK